AAGDGFDRTLFDRYFGELIRSPALGHFSVIRRRAASQGGDGGAFSGWDLARGAAALGVVQRLAFGPALTPIAHRLHAAIGASRDLRVGVLGMRQEQNLGALHFAIESRVGLSGFRQLAYLLWCQFDLILWFQARHLNPPFDFAICLGMLLSRLTMTQPSTYF